MSEVGLLQPLIINKTTGWLLGGHQRLASMDALEKYKDGKNDYQIDVAMVELTEKEEAEMLVFLNNASASGTWDTDLLAELNLDMGVKFDSMGFEKLDIELIFDGDSRFDGFFADTIEQIEQKQSLQNIEAQKRGGSQLDRFEHQKDHAEDLSPDFYVTVVFNNQEEKQAMLKRLRIPKGELYISGGLVMDALGDKE
jgi:hypothetical protein